MSIESPEDIRWKQRFQNFNLALSTLTEAFEVAQTRSLSKLEAQSLIQGFEFTHELSWNVLKDYLEEQGFPNIIGSINATRLAFKESLIAPTCQRCEHRWETIARPS